ncbi:hypothetical protein BDQ17DRAFT_1372553 [Cyathus striatus]|nr:hypothetical protein BDQ17DRAFT_1372553 [Cyathus striatus]
MFALRRCARPSHTIPFRQYAAAAHARKVTANPALDDLHKLEREHARLLCVVKRRIEDRARLMSELSDEMSSPEDIARLRQISQSAPLQDAWDEWARKRELLVETIPFLTDPEMHSLAEQDYAELTKDLTHCLESQFPSLLVPPSPTSNLSALMELKSGVGGSESSLFLGDLLRMYQRLASSSRWKVTIVAKNDTENGGIKDAVVEVKGEGVYDTLRWESGVHRVQRIPATDSSGRTHTSTVAVMVLPLVEEDANSKEEELFSMDDVKIEVMRSRGAGGQHVNKTESAVRLTHLPTGVTVSMQDERSQHQNRRRAFQVLRSRLLDIKLRREMEERRTARTNLVKGMDRSEKIRTYNYPQDRVTDHRIGLTVNNLPSVMEGEGIYKFLDRLKKDYEETLMEDALNDVD